MVYVSYCFSSINNNCWLSFGAELSSSLLSKKCKDLRCTERWFLVCCFVLVRDLPSHWGRNIVWGFFFLFRNQQSESTWVLYELVCWLSVVVRSPPARRSLSWIHSTVDWCMAPRKWGFYLKSKSTNYPDHGHHGDPPPTRKIPTVEPGIEPGTSWLVARISDH